MIKKGFSYFLMLLIVFGLLITLSIFVYLATPPSYAKNPKTIEVPQGTHFTHVADTLKKEGIIKSIWGFSLLVGYLQGTTQIKAGEYLFNTDMLPLEVAEILLKGKVLQYGVTIPEGYTIYQIADLLHRSKFTIKEKFLESCYNPLLLSSWGIKGDSLEGYLFPDTYKLPRNIDEKGILTLMLSRFKNVYNEKYAEKANKLGFSMKDVVTLASIIEKETGKPSERPLISAVFHNRLKKRIRLQSDPTAIYGLNDFKGKIRKRHLKRDTPYNTYIHSGLPPGPIANPGEASIRAVLYPAEVDYLYFVSKNDGSHHFSNNLNEHNRAVWKYQKR
ncbi:MAG: endolytic transglycosylase MltG [Thermodesulfobacteriota bacterium]|nr:endolytic transglycosylase MltG [Thermodesulfobacteriota bacterium]